MDQLSEHEHAVTAALINAQNIETSRRLMADRMLVTEVQVFDRDRSILQFQIPDCDHGQSQRLLPVKGTLRDQDGALVQVMLFDDSNGRLMELELVRPDGEDLIGPVWATFAVDNVV